MKERETPTSLVTVYNAGAEESGKNGRNERSF